MQVLGTYAFSWVCSTSPSLVLFRGGPAVARARRQARRADRRRSRPAGAVVTTGGFGLDGNLRSIALEGGAQIGYTYDESGNWLTRTVNGANDASWAWDTVGGLSVRTSERDAAGAIAHKWWAGPQSGLGTALADTTSGTPAWLIGDYQGSITDLAGVSTLTGSATLDPFGTATGATGAYTDNPLRWHGQYQDTRTVPSCTTRGPATTTPPTVDVLQHHPGPIELGLRRRSQTRRGSRTLADESRRHGCWRPRPGHLVHNGRQHRAECLQGV